LRSLKRGASTKDQAECALGIRCRTPVVTERTGPRDAGNLSPYPAVVLFQGVCNECDGEASTRFLGQELHFY
jgi:hypothetical protein